MFEPTFLQEALSEDTLNLGHLIFGCSDWRDTTDAPVGSPVQPDDPLTQVYAELGTTLMYSTLNMVSLTLSFPQVC